MNLCPEELVGRFSMKSAQNMLPGWYVSLACFPVVLRMLQFLLNEHETHLFATMSHILLA